MQFVDNIFLLQCLKKEITTAKELDLRLFGKVIIFRDKQTDKQNLPIIYRLYSVFPIKQHWTSFHSLSTTLCSQDFNLSVIFNVHRNSSQSLSTICRGTWRKIQTDDHWKLQGRNLTLNVAPSWKHNQRTLNEVCLNCKVKNQMDW